MAFSPYSIHAALIAHLLGGNRPNPFAPGTPLFPPKPDPYGFGSMPLLERPFHTWGRAVEGLPAHAANPGNYSAPVEPVYLGRTQGLRNWDPGTPWPLRS